MFGDYYILDDDHRPVLTRDRRVWGAWMANLSNRIIAQTELSAGVWVSTVFLGLDHRHRFGGHDGPALLFETMVFTPSEEDGDRVCGECHRYSDWSTAEAGHKATCNRWRAAVLQAAKLAGADAPIPEQPVEELRQDKA